MLCFGCLKDPDLTDTNGNATTTATTQPRSLNNRRPSLTDVIKSRIQVIVVPRKKTLDDTKKAVTWRETVSVNEFTPVTSVASVEWNEEYNSRDSIGEESISHYNEDLGKWQFTEEQEDSQTPTPPMSPVQGKNAWRSSINEWRSSLIPEGEDMKNDENKDSSITGEMAEDDGIILGESAIDNDSLPIKPPPPTITITSSSPTQPSTTKPSLSKTLSRNAPSLSITTTLNTSNNSNKNAHKKLPRPRTPLHPTPRIHSVNLSADDMSEITPSATTPLYTLPKRTSSISKSSIYTINKKESLIFLDPKRGNMSNDKNIRMSIQEAMNEFSWLKGFLNNE